MAAFDEGGCTFQTTDHLDVSMHDLMGKGVDCCIFEKGLDKLEGLFLKGSVGFRRADDEVESDADRDALVDLLSFGCPGGIRKM